MYLKMIQFYASTDTYGLNFYVITTGMWYLNKNECFKINLIVLAWVGLEEKTMGKP